MLICSRFFVSRKYVLDPPFFVDFPPPPHHWPMYSSEPSRLEVTSVQLSIIEFVVPSSYQDPILDVAPFSAAMLVFITFCILFLCILYVINKNTQQFVRSKTLLKQIIFEDLLYNFNNLIFFFFIYVLHIRSPAYKLMYVQ